MTYAIEDIAPLIKEWTINTRLPEIIEEMKRRYYYRMLIEQNELSREAEIYRCKSNPAHWFNHWVWTYDPRGMPFGLPANIPLFCVRVRLNSLIG